jgi:hypothetical protein
VSDGAAPLFDRRSRAAFLVAGMTMLLGGLGFRSAVGWLNVVLRKEPVPIRQHLGQIPRSLGPWRAIGDDIVLDEASIEALGTPNYLNRVYEYEEGEHRGETLMLHIAYYTGMIDAVPHVPDRCFGAAGWSPASSPRTEPLAIAYPQAEQDPTGATLDGEPYSMLTVPRPVTGRDDRVRLPVGAYELRTRTYARDDSSGHVMYGGFFFIANHRLTASPLDIRALAFQPSERHAYFAKVQLQLPADAADDPAIFPELSSDLLERLIPHLMRCLPDWAEVEAGAAHAL